MSPAKQELLDRQRWRTRQQLANAIFEWLEGFYNPVRRHSALGNLWKVGSSATLGTYPTLRGNVLALASITVTTGVTVNGRTLTQTAAVTLDTNTITRS